MTPLRLVLDTNIVVSAAMKPDGLQRTVVLVATTKPARLYVTEPILAEYREVLARPELNIRKGHDNVFLECADACTRRLLGNWESKTLPEVLEGHKSDYRARLHQHRGSALRSVIPRLLGSGMQRAAHTLLQSYNLISIIELISISSRSSIRWASVSATQHD